MGKFKPEESEHHSFAESKLVEWERERQIRRETALRRKKQKQKAELMKRQEANRFSKALKNEKNKYTSSYKPINNNQNDTRTTKIRSDQRSQANNSKTTNFQEYEKECLTKQYGNYFYGSHSKKKSSMHPQSHKPSKNMDNQETENNDFCLDESKLPSWCTPETVSQPKKYEIHRAVQRKEQSQSKEEQVLENPKAIIACHRSNVDKEKTPLLLNPGNPIQSNSINISRNIIHTTKNAALDLVNVPPYTSQKYKKDKCSISPCDSVRKSLAAEEVEEDMGLEIYDSLEENSLSDSIDSIEEKLDKKHLDNIPYDMTVENHESAKILDSLDLSVTYSQSARLTMKKRLLRKDDVYTASKNNPITLQEKRTLHETNCSNVRTEKERNIHHNNGKYNLSVNHTSNEGNVKFGTSTLTKTKANGSMQPTSQCTIILGKEKGSKSFLQQPRISGNLNSKVSSKRNIVNGGMNGNKLKRKEVNSSKTSIHNDRKIEKQEGLTKECNKQGSSPYNAIRSDPNLMNGDMYTGFKRDNRNLCPTKIDYEPTINSTLKTKKMAKIATQFSIEEANLKKSLMMLDLKLQNVAERRKYPIREMYEDIEKRTLEDNRQKIKENINLVDGSYGGGNHYKGFVKSNIPFNPKNPRKKPPTLGNSTRVRTGGIPGRPTGGYIQTQNPNGDKVSVKKELAHLLLS